MRKLIEELQTEIERRDLKDAALEGLFLALQIVKSYDPWIDVSELPPERGNAKMFSIVVIISDGISTDLGYYDFECKTWRHKNILGDFTPIKWTYLPEAKS